MKNIILLAICFLGMSVLTVFAGEVSNFEIIGFDNDMRYMSFTEYGLDEDTKPYASIFFVDIDNNRFVPGGVFRETYHINDAIENDGRGALYQQILNANKKFEEYRINTLNNGRLIYILLNEEGGDGPLEFVDHDTGYHYSVSLTQTIKGVGTAATGAFAIDVSVNDNGTVYTRSVGDKHYYRKGVARYKIRSIYTTTRTSTLVFVVEKLSFSKKGESNIHYMVETINWK